MIVIAVTGPRYFAHAQCQPVAQQRDRMAETLIGIETTDGQTTRLF
jgi:hypothetical protein